LTVTSSTFTNNTATNYDGGAIWNHGGTLTTPVTISGSTFTGNNATSGGAIYNYGTLTVTSSTFTNNTATNYGGAINNQNTLTITGSTFTGNTADYGGAISHEGTLTVTDSTFTNNTATNYGGAIYNYDVLTVTDSTFTNNTATIRGGAIYNEGNLTVTDSTFTNNTATSYGGAIYNTGALTVTDSTFTGNTANQGGAIYNYDVLTVTDSTFTGNTANQGGAIYNDGNLTITSSNFTGNNATGPLAYGGAIYNYDGAANVHFNQIVGNTANLGIAIYNDGGTLDAALNWWGDNNGPAGKVVGLTVTNWLVLTLSAVPGSISINGNSIVTADLIHDKNSVIQTGGHVPDGIPITFSGTLGNINPTSRETVNGVATTTFTGLTPGIAVVKVMADNQTVTNDITVNSQWKLVNYTYKVYEPVKKWYKKWYKSNRHWKYYWKSYYVKAWTKKWYKSHGKWRYRWVKVTKYTTQYLTGQKWVLA
jgi:predicted outer membrane repeat protein